ncbi:MAG: S8 family serine peptidase, partial [Bacteroidota bacterium]
MSPVALANRATQGIALDHHDLPVSNLYVEELKYLDVEPLTRTRWFNGVSAYLEEDQLALVANLPFVDRIQPVLGLQGRISEKQIQSSAVQEDDFTHLRQLEMIGLDQLHYSGLTGKGIRVAVFDNGFDQVDELPGFRHLFAENRIIATRDLVDGDEDVYHPCSHCRHGTYVFSILAAVMPGELIGSAPGAEFILLRTENDDSETRQEEDNWLAAAEFADSLGAQIFTTSLGYYNFDGSAEDYGPNDLNGNTALITRAGDMAASRGILVVNSAGNSGSRGLVAPADGDSVIVVGAVDYQSQYASFSSRGPRVDGAVKPNLAAMGRDNFFLHPNGGIRQGSGTSFSCPMVSGLAACLWQAYPQLSAWEIYNFMRNSASQAFNPDGFMGYGIPNGLRAIESMQQSLIPQTDFSLRDDYRSALSFPQDQFVSYPNPAQDHLYLKVELG